MKKLYCITCPSGCQLTVIGSGYEMVVDGNKCDRGYEFVKAEMSNPTRTLTTTVRTKFPGVPVISVRTDGEIPREMLFEAIKELSKVVIDTELSCGDTVLEDLLKTGVRVIVTSSALMQLGAELENKNVELDRLTPSGGSGGAMDSSAGGGLGIVRNAEGVLDDFGADNVGGFVGAAGEAVGVESAEDDDEMSAEEKAEEIKEHFERKSRPHIKRK